MIIWELFLELKENIEWNCGGFTIHWLKNASRLQIYWSDYCKSAEATIANLLE
ncbi:MAG: hypothetical protein WCK18_04345 [Prolixibacteraceae bacterium]